MSADLRVCLCCSTSALPGPEPARKGKAAGLRCHPNFSKVFPSSAAPQGITQSLTGCLTPGGEGTAFGLCVWLISAPVNGSGPTSGSAAVHRHLCATKARLGPSLAKGSEPTQVTGCHCTWGPDLPPQPTASPCSLPASAGSGRGLKGVLARWAAACQICHKDGAHQLGSTAQLHPRAPFPTHGEGPCARRKGREPSARSCNRHGVMLGTARAPPVPQPSAATALPAHGCRRSHVQASSVRSLPRSPPDFGCSNT